MTVDTVLRIARAQIGVTESPAGSNKVKYNTWYYGREVSGGAYPWCMTFVQWVFRKAGYTLYPLTASCGMFKSQHKNEWITSGYEPGDIVLFDFDKRNGNGDDHVGIVERVEGDVIVTIEGNTSRTSDDNGGAVMRRKDHTKYITGGWRPPYEANGKEDNMTGKEIYEELTKYINSLPESEWSKTEGAFQRAIGAKITDGTYPRGFLTREQLFAVLDRLDLID